MKARHSYLLLFLLTSAMIAFLAAFVIAAAGAGILWIFVYGDNSWPESANTALMVLVATASVLTFATLVALSYSFGKDQETRGGLRRSHMVSSLGVSIGLPLLVLLHQWQVGNIGDEPAPAVDSSFAVPLPARHDTSALPVRVD